LGISPQIVNTFDWYWIIGSETNVYQSSSNTRVPPDDTNYVAWQDAHGLAVPVSDEAGLKSVLQTHIAPIPDWLYEAADTFIQPSPGAYTPDQLKSYSASIRYTTETGGITITSISSIPFLTDPVSRNTVNSTWNYVNSAAGQQTVNWKMSDGSFVTISETNVKVMADDMAAFVQACFDCEASTAGDIDTGTTTTLAQIDAGYAAISTVYP
jgi:hypothetical protein